MILQVKLIQMRSHSNVTKYAFRHRNFRFILMQPSAEIRELTNYPCIDILCKVQQNHKFDVQGRHSDTKKQKTESKQSFPPKIYLPGSKNRSCNSTFHCKDVPDALNTELMKERFLKKVYGLHYH